MGNSADRVRQLYGDPLTNVTEIFVSDSMGGLKFQPVPKSQSIEFNDIQVLVQLDCTNLLVGFRDSPDKQCRRFCILGTNVSTDWTKNFFPVLWTAVSMCNISRSEDKGVLELVWNQANSPERTVFFDPYTPPSTPRSRPVTPSTLSIQSAYPLQSLRYPHFHNWLQAIQSEWGEEEFQKQFDSGQEITGDVLDAGIAHLLLSLQTKWNLENVEVRDTHWWHAEWKPDDIAPPDFLTCLPVPNTVMKEFVVEVRENNVVVGEKKINREVTDHWFLWLVDRRGQSSGRRPAWFVYDSAGSMNKPHPTAVTALSPYYTLNGLNAPEIGVCPQQNETTTSTCALHVLRNLEFILQHYGGEFNVGGRIEMNAIPETEAMTLARGCLRKNLEALLAVANYDDKNKTECARDAAVRDWALKNPPNLTVCGLA